MQISNNLNQNISFQKKLKANCAVLKDGEPIDCKIYQLESGKDDDYFVDLQNVASWITGRFTKTLDEFIKNGIVPTKEIYVIEDENEKCLGYCQIEDENPHELGFNFLETIPKRFSDSEYKYTGETMLAFMTKKAKAESKESVVAQTVIRPSRKFYKKNDFKLTRSIRTLGLVWGFLNEKNYDKLLDKNESHTNKSIELIS